jgi:cysteine desulfurase
MTEKRFVYMDNAATTKIHPDVVSAMLPYMTEYFGNPSSLYDFSQTPKKAIENARELVAHVIGCNPAEIYFTAGGTESDNWAIKGVAFANQKKGKHIITSSIEHHAVIHPCEWLVTQGFEVTFLPVDEYGTVSPESVAAAIRDDTILVSIMFANNEIGTIEPIAEIGAICKERGVYFHTDAVQAIGHVPINVDAMNIDLLSLSAHKFHGPKGAGCLYIRKNVKIDRLIHGGGQESKRRAGTENVPGIVGLAAAIERAVAVMPESNKHIQKLRDRLIEGLLTIPHSRLNGHPVHRLSNNVNIIFEFIEGESILLLLNQYGVAASTGSACTSTSLEPSHVLTACGISHDCVHGSLRLTLGEETTEEDISYVIEILPGIVQRLRDMSPLTPDELRSAKK